MKMLSFMLTVLMTGQVAEESHWTHTNAALLVTGSQIWRVNRAESMSEQQLVQLFDEAQLAQHREIKDRNILVFKKGARVALKSPTDPNSQAGKSNESSLMERLQELGMRIPSEGVVFTTASQLGGVEELVQSAQSETQPIRQWNLLGKSRLVGPEVKADDPQKQRLIPVSDYSVLIEWGHRNSIHKVQESLMAAVTDKPGDVAVNEAAIYERHFYKLPLRLEVRASSPDDIDETEPKLIGNADPLYLVRPRREGGGYLIYLTSAERTGRQVVALQLPRFDVTEKPNGTTQEISVDIPALCFMKNVLQVSVRNRTPLKLPDLSNANLPAGTKRLFKAGADKQWLMTLNFSVPKTNSKATESASENPANIVDRNNTARFLLEADTSADSDTVQEDGISYSANLAVVKDALVPFNDHPVRIFSSNCEELQRLTPTLKNAAEPKKPQ